jgi:hypothetical protein
MLCFYLRDIDLPHERTTARAHKGTIRPFPALATTGFNPRLRELRTGLLNPDFDRSVHVRVVFVTFLTNLAFHDDWGC